MVKGRHDKKHKMTKTPSMCMLQCLWFIVGAILHLGEVGYDQGEDGYAKVKDANLLKKISKVSFETMAIQRYN